MKRILIIYYSHSGTVVNLVKSFVKNLEASKEVALTWESIQPKTTYSYPWKLYQFFDVFPECINEEPPEIEQPQFNPNDKFDLIILAYPVWFLAPALPMQGFLKSDYAKVMKDTKVITLIGCRNMWHSASERMKHMIAKVGGIHIDNVVVTHQGSPIATFITTPRLLLTGKRDKFLGVLPSAGFLDEEVDSVSRFGEYIATHLNALDEPSSHSLLKGLETVKVNRNYIIPERIGRAIYRPWAKLIRLFGCQGSWTRIPLLFLFAIQLLIAIPLVLSISTLLKIIFAPLLNAQLERYTQALKSPSQFPIDG